MTASRRAGRGERGRRAERFAERWLVRRGARILARNWRVKGGELDLVVLHHGTLVAVEVRYRSSTALLHPVSSVTWHKSRRLFHALRCFIHCHPRFSTLPMRIDLIGISGDLDHQPSLRWIRSAVTLDDLADC